jgi:hypothetical protein
MKPEVTDRKAVALAALLIIAMCSLVSAGVKGERVDKWFGRITVEGTVDSLAVSELDRQLDSLRQAEGILLDLRIVREADATTALERFTDEPLILDTLKIEPRGPWQYVNPLLIMSDSTATAFPILHAFQQERRWTRLETSGDSTRALRRLKDLDAEFRIDRQERMDRLFHK